MNIPDLYTAIRVVAVVFAIVLLFDSSACAYVLLEKEPVTGCRDDDTLSPESIIVSCKWALKVVNREGDPVAALYYNAIAEERIGRYKAAQNDLLFDIAGIPSADIIWRRFIEVSGKLGEPPSIAMDVLDELVKKHPGDITTLVGACWTRAALNQQPDTALADCNEALRIKPDAQALHARCFVRLRRGEFGLAAADCDAAVKIMPIERSYIALHNRADAFYVRGLINLRMSHADLGNADIAAAKADDPKIAETYAGYGVTP